jgi:hypothetical protein
MKKMDKQLIQEVSRIHELMGVNNLIVESNRFTRLADDLVDIIKTVKGTDDISKLSRSEQDFFNALDAAVAGNKEDEIIDILKSYEKTSGVSKYVDEINTALFNKINNEIPELNTLKNTVEDAKNSQTGGPEDITDEDIVNLIDSRMAEVEGSDYYKTLYKNRLKKELGISDTVKTTRVTDDVIDLSPEAIAAREANAQRLADEAAASREREVAALEDDATRLSGAELEAKMDEFIDSWSKKLYEADLNLPKKKRWFKTNQDYVSFVTEVKKGMKSAYKAFGESIDSIPEKWFEDFKELPAEQQKDIFERAIRGASTFKPKGKGSKVWGGITKGYDWATLKPLYSKLPGGSAQGWKGFFRRLGYRYLTTILGQMWFTYINSMYKKFTDEELINWSSTNVLDDWISGGADAGSPKALAGDFVSFLTGPIFLPWNVFANTISTAEYLGSTPDEVSGGFTQSQIKTLQDQGLTASDTESIQTILDFISTVTGETVEGSETLDPKLTADITAWRALYKTFTSIGQNKNYADLLYGLPTSSGINQFVVDKNKELWYVANNGAYKIEGEGQNSYITAVNSEGQEVQIKIKDIFDDKFNRFLPEYKPVSEQPTSESFVQFWPEEIRWDGRGSSKQNSELSTLIGVHNSNLASLLSPIKKYLLDEGINLPSKYLQTYGFYSEDDITREQDGNITVQAGTEEDSFPYLVDDGSAYRIKEADKDYFNLKDTDGDYVRGGEYYVTDGSEWAKLTKKAREILRTSDNSQTQNTTTPSSQASTPQDLWKQQYPNGSIKPVGNVNIYYTEPNYGGDRYKLENNKFVKF